MPNATKDDRKDINEWRQAQGAIHESATLNTIGGDAINLNGDAAKGYRGGKYPTFDISSSTEICSVKSHISQDGVLTNQNVNGYIHDFEHMLGWNRDIAYNELDGKLLPIEQDAKRIADLQGRGIPIPESLSNASSDRIVEYLKHDTVMRIPEDHVSAVQDELERKAREIPENYYLSNPPSNSEIATLRDRVKSTGLTAEETINQLKAGYSPEQAGSNDLSSQVSQQTTTSNSQISSQPVQVNSNNAPTQSSTSGNSFSQTNDEDHIYSYGQ